VKSLSKNCITHPNLKKAEAILEKFEKSFGLQFLFQNDLPLHQPHWTLMVINFQIQKQLLIILTLNLLKVSIRLAHKLLKLIYQP